MEEGIMETYIDNQGNIVCSIHMDASVMNKHDQCDECLDDAHEAQILNECQECLNGTHIAVQLA